MCGFAVYDTAKMEGRIPAERELTNAFANSKITLTEDNLRKYISEYAKKGYHDYGTYAEAFAEAVSDNKPNRITGYIQNIIRSW